MAWSSRGLVSGGREGDRRAGQVRGDGRWRGAADRAILDAVPCPGVSRMTDPAAACLVAPDAPSLPLYPVRPGGLATLLDTLPEAQAGFLRATGFTGSAGDPVLLGDAGGLAGAVLGLGEDRSPHAFG